MKSKIILIAILFLLIGCNQKEVMHEAKIPAPAEILSCTNPQGLEYICYSDAECKEMMSGYSAVFTMKTATPEESEGWGQSEEHPVIYMNLYNDRTELRLVGKITGEKRDGKWYMHIWTIVCDFDDTILHESYSEGFRKEKHEH